MVSVNVRKSNKGMSLVELLVAVAIFVAAIVPMLYAFVYSTGFNFKAQRTMQSTGIAQALIEKCKGSNVDYDDIKAMLDANPSTNIADSIFAGTNFTAPVRELPHGTSHTWWFKGVSAVRTAELDVDGSDTTRRSYDVEFTIEPIEFSRTDTMSIQSMSSQTANFCNEYTRHLYEEDQVAVNKLKDQLFDLFRDSNIYLVGGAELPAALRTGSAAKFGSVGSVSGENELRENIVPRRLIIDRKIVITADNTGVKVKVEYYFGGFNKEISIPGGSNYLSYDGVNFESRAISAYFAADHTTRDIVCIGTFTGPIANGSTPFYCADINNDGTQDTDGYYILTNNSDPDNYVRASACYFYFYPGYVGYVSNQYNASYNDTFYLENTMSSSCLANPADANSEIKRFDFYLFKQYNKDYNDQSYVTDTMFDYFENEYKPHIYVNSNIGGGGSIAAFDTYLHHNFFYNVRELYVNGDDGVKNSFASPAIYESHIHIDSTHKCFNDTTVEVSNTTYENDFRNSAGLGRLFMSSRVLSDEAILPYWHEGTSITDSNDPQANMYVTRYKITINVYRGGSAYGADDLIETMESEVLNW